jgi:hypothetical protein
MDEEVHYPTRPVDKDKAEQELVVNIKKATSPEETAPKQKHVRSAFPLCDDERAVTYFTQNALFIPGTIIRPYLSGAD